MSQHLTFLGLVKVEFETMDITNSGVNLVWKLRWWYPSLRVSSPEIFV